MDVNGLYIARHEVPLVQWQFQAQSYGQDSPAALSMVPHCKGEAAIMDSLIIPSPGNHHKEALKLQKPRKRRELQQILRRASTIWPS